MVNPFFLLEFFVFSVCACRVDQQFSSHAILKIEWLAWLKDKLVISADITKVAQLYVYMHGIQSIYQQHAWHLLLFTSKFVRLAGVNAGSKFIRFTVHWLKYLLCSTVVFSSSCLQQLCTYGEAGITWPCGKFHPHGWSLSDVSTGSD